MEFVISKDSSSDRDWSWNHPLKASVAKAHFAWIKAYLIWHYQQESWNEQMSIFGGGKTATLTNMKWFFMWFSCSKWFSLMMQKFDERWQSFFDATQCRGRIRAGNFTLSWWPFFRGIFDPSTGYISMQTSDNGIFRYLLKKIIDGKVNQHCICDIF